MIILYTQNKMGCDVAFKVKLWNFDEIVKIKCMARLSFWLEDISSTFYQKYRERLDQELAIRLPKPCCPLFQIVLANVLHASLEDLHLIGANSGPLTIFFMFQWKLVYVVFSVIIHPIIFLCVHNDIRFFRWTVDNY